MHYEPRRPCAAVFITAAFFLSAALVVKAAWIPLKAEAAQWLMARSWQQIQAGHPQSRPWPWADTRPAGVLSVPRLGIEQFVLEGNSGRNLAFGPVFTDGAPAAADRVISGHRDTHFRFLRDLRPGDRIHVQTPQADVEYEVAYLEVVDSRHRELVLEPARARLSLVTCFPFDAPAAGGPLRYVVTARAVDEPGFRPGLPAVSSG